jgi:hypothetical protein
MAHMQRIGENGLGLNIWGIDCILCDCGRVYDGQNTPLILDMKSMHHIYNSLN